MSYCFNPVCSNRQNPEREVQCLTCGSPLVVNNRYRGRFLLGESRSCGAFLVVDEEDKNRNNLVLKQFFPIVKPNRDPVEIRFYYEIIVNDFFKQTQQLQRVGKDSRIPKIVDYFEQNRRLYLVEEFISGESLLEELQEEGSFRLKDIKEILIQLLQLLKFLHENQVIHGNIKPDNILRRARSGENNSGENNANTEIGPGELVLIDFNISLEDEDVTMGWASTGVAKLTHQYAPPEQIRCGAIYPASDLYSLGVTCMRLLTKVEIDELYDSLKGGWRWSEAIEPIETESEQLAPVLKKLLEEGLNDRYQTAEQALVDLGETITSETKPTAGSSTAGSSTPPPQELATVQGHQGWVWSVSFSPDGKYMASGSSDNNIILWDVSKRMAIDTLIGHSQLVLAAVFNRDGTILASGSRDKKIILWDVASCKSIRTLGGWFSGHSELVNSLVFSPEGQTLISGGWDSKVILWDVATGKLRDTLKGHSGWVYSVAIDPDGAIIASGSRDQTIILWNVRTGKPIRTIDSGLGLVNVVAFSPDGRILAAGGFQPNKIILWDVETGERIRVLIGHTERVNSIAFSPDGNTLASGSRDETIILWDVNTGQLRHTLTGHSERVFSVAFSPDGRLLASGAGDDTIKLWQI